MMIDYSLSPNQAKQYEEEITILIPTQINERKGEPVPGKGGGGMTEQSRQIETSGQLTTRGFFPLLVLADWR
jgi:hypothetical protein